MPSAEARARQAAQRRLAKEIHEGTFKPSRIGKKARELASLKAVRDLAFINILDKLDEYLFFNVETVEANVYGGETSESGKVPGMSREQALWTADADAEELRSRASEQRQKNEWYYH